MDEVDEDGDDDELLFIVLPDNDDDAAVLAVVVTIDEVVEAAMLSSDFDVFRLRCRRRFVADVCGGRINLGLGRVGGGGLEGGVGCCLLTRAFI